MLLGSILLPLDVGRIELDGKRLSDRALLVVFVRLPEDNFDLVKREILSFEEANALILEAILPAAVVTVLSPSAVALKFW